MFVRYDVNHLLAFPSLYHTLFSLWFEVFDVSNIGLAGKARVSTLQAELQVDHP